MAQLANSAGRASPRGTVWQRIGIKPRRVVWTLLLYAILLGLSGIVLLPVFWMVSTALKPQSEIFAFPPIWIPHPVVWSNFIDALTAQPFALFARNTLLLVVVNIIGFPSGSSRAFK